MSGLIKFFTTILSVCRLVPMLPVVVIAAIPLALLGDWRPWGDAIAMPVLGGPGLGQWLVIVLVLIIVVDTVRGMIDDLRHGRAGVDLLAVVAILSTVAVHEYWASWAVALMVTSGEAIEEYAQAKAEHSLTVLLDAAPRTAHVVTLPGVGRGLAADKGDSSDGFRRVDSALAMPSPQAVSPQSASPTAPLGEGSQGGGAGLSSLGDVGSRSKNQETWLPALRGAGSRSDTEGSQSRGQAAAHRFDTVPVEQVKLDDVLMVLPGETVPVDGELLSGSATLDLSNINGEPMPREVFAGARVMSGAVNGSTALAMRATQLAADSQYQRILELVSSAQESRPAVVKTADRLAVPFTVLSLAIAGIAWAVSGVPTRFAQVLVLATPCPLLIAAPVAYIAGTGRLAAAGVLIKAQDVLENLGRVTQVFFDKTGTLTVKQPQVVRVEMLPGAAAQLDEDHVLMMAGVVESYSVHILSKGIAKAGAEAMARLRRRFEDGQRLCPEPEASWPGHGREYPVVKNINEDAGKGVSGEVNGHAVRVGRLSFAAAGEDGFLAVDRTTSSQSATDSPRRRGREAVVPADDIRTRFGLLQPDEMASYVSVDGRLIARIVLRDVPRANAKTALAELHALGVAKLAMLTGDKRASAEIIASEVGIDEVHAELFPEDKVAAVKAATNGNAVTMMVGDGVNDAPVLAVADIGVAMTDGTSTAASESAQVVVMNDDIAAVPRAIAIARRTKRVMLQAVIAGLALALVGMVAAAFNLIPVVVGAFLQEAIDVVSILWALTALIDRD
ncbi:heavy metal translocating P-type ATPase [Bifidobacterium scardovii]|uniref:E1-E2 ATPase n=1 Tax=Bifidobacterium scardovii TaxID=158787 RepID=A0A087DDR4_9BIFI|nr:heavy metal translocating P-type ATPase [Bifidobacterium scardovii]KFI93664.1 E1-E2 ATPase [Bifidobacterium scardovii]MDK6348678.1 heavy metal translocating P-type ATPase [Bifidobacterium scardovii]MDU8982769.1 heavy metal translocating P-type ATPase [Bifidobacterium scardovii]BAQ30203.1 cation-transporting ATPase V [Bifidobacterium scardovii JCM 12489 = DSM 13734]